MDDVKCPKCRGPIETRREDGGDPWGVPVGAGAWCRSCGEEWRQAEDMEHLAHWEPRDRLPTPEEEDAHTAKHGAEAGWMANQGMGWHPVDDAAEMEILRGFVGESWRSYPHVDGRPVGWPEVKS